MSFVPKKQAYSARINTVTLGVGDKATVIGGQNVLPFYTFDAPIEHAPKVGVEISDAAASWDVEGRGVKRGVRKNAAGEGTAGGRRRDSGL